MYMSILNNEELWKTTLLLLDPRTVLPGEDESLVAAVRAALEAT